MSTIRTNISGIELINDDDEILNIRNTEDNSDFIELTIDGNSWIFNRKDIGCICDALKKIANI